VSIHQFLPDRHGVATPAGDLARWPRDRFADAGGARESVVTSLAGFGVAGGAGSESVVHPIGRFAGARLPQAPGNRIAMPPPSDRWPRSRRMPVLFWMRRNDQPTGLAQ